METPTANQPVQMVIDIEDSSIVNDLRRLLKHISGLGKIRVNKVAHTQSKAKMTEEEFYAKLDRSIESAKTGPLYTMQEGETGEEFINRLLSM